MSLKMDRGRVPPPDFNVMRCAPGGLGQTRKRLPLVREKAGFAHVMANSGTT